MIKIKLSLKTWYYNPDKQLGPKGGFGVVFYGEDEDKNECAIKKLNVDANEIGHRELRLADDFVKKDFKNIIQVYDSGQDAESDNYYIVMALAEKSLQDELENGISFNDFEAKEILLSIINGLLEVPHIIHRDLKPCNILFHKKHWKIADFGIARFVEETTSLRTLKGWLSDQYAAPEQWNFEHPTKNTDIYALGCIGYTLLTGSPPFNGTNREDLKQQHLYEEPPRLKNNNPLLCSLLLMMLRKNSDARPSIERVKAQLERIEFDSKTKIDLSIITDLQKIGQMDAAEKSKEEAEKKFKEAHNKKLHSLEKQAWDILKDIIEHLFKRIQDNTQTANIHNGTSINLRSVSSISLGKAKLIIDYLIELGLSYENRFPKSGWDVIVGATILVSQEIPKNKWGASLWYMRRHPNNDYRWYEVSYMANPFLKNHPKYEPFEINNFSDADEAAAPGIGRYQIAHNPEPIDDENEEKFIENWLKRFVQAFKSQLQRPSRLPY
ncbi:serine/threonine protein kinase [candidate division KSB1 bacterium]|nr:serine/threonine protein kinase [candidate division KSB1 bacterium]